MSTLKRTLMDLLSSSAFSFTSAAKDVTVCFSLKSSVLIACTSFNSQMLVFGVIVMSFAVMLHILTGTLDVFLGLSSITIVQTLTLLVHTLTLLVQTLTLLVHTLTLLVQTLTLLVQTLTLVTVFPAQHCTVTAASRLCFFLPILVWMYLHPSGRLHYLLQPLYNASKISMVEMKDKLCDYCKLVMVLQNYLMLH